VLLLARNDRTADALETLRSAMELAEGLDDAGLRALILRLRGHLATDPKVAMPHHRTASQLWRSAGNRKELARELNYIGILWAAQGAHSEAEVCFRRGASQLKALNLRRDALMLSTNLGLAQAQLRDFEAARETLDSATEDARALGSTLMLLHSQASTLELALLQGDEEKVARTSEDLFADGGLRKIPGVEVRNFLFIALSYSVVLRSQGLPSQAVEFTRGLMKDTAIDPRGSRAVPCLVELSAALAQSGQLEEARELRDACLTIPAQPVDAHEQTRMQSLLQITLQLYAIEHRSEPPEPADRDAILNALSAFEQEFENGAPLGVLCRFAVIQREAARILGSSH